jgi:EAL domain-containing protein (putative c-di-GMP-specific phosphodiesterase class I)
MRERAAHRLDTELALREALKRDELRLFYQPMVDLRTGALAGLEALIRWEHPERGLMEPADFLALAEETWLIVPIGKWVLEQALRQGARWRAETGGAMVPISVNVSGRQVTRPHFAATVAAALAATDTEPGMLSLEVTESAVGEARATLHTLSRLRDGGVKLSLDDFGTGVASLSALTRYPVDTLKVDRSLVDGVYQRSRDSSVVAAILALGCGLGLSAVAEGIERAEQVAALRALGCQVGQGNYFAPPLPAEAILSFLAARAGEPFSDLVGGVEALTESAAA